jgi:hypothetical protein
MMNAPTPFEHEELRGWLVERFDRIDDKIERKLDALQREVVDTRHAQKGSLDQIALDLVRNIERSIENTRRIDSINTWRSEGGPLQQRFHEIDERQDQTDAWRNRMLGAIAVVVTLFPVTVGIVVSILAR